MSYLRTFFFFCFTLAWALLAYYCYNIYTTSPYEDQVLALQRMKRQEWCDEQYQYTKLQVARFFDSQRIRLNWLSLWDRFRSTDPQKFVRIGPGIFQLTPSSREELQEYHLGWDLLLGEIRRYQGKHQRRMDLQEMAKDFQALVFFDVNRHYYGMLETGASLAQKNYKLRKSSAVKLVGTELEVLLDSGDFKGAEDEIKKLLETSWNRFERKIRIRWASQKEGAYRLRFHSEPQLSHVDHQKKELHMANGSSLNVFAHELGHVLGFQDHYRTEWKSQYCYYTQQSQRSDIMSSASLGQVLKEHWDILEAYYFPKAKHPKRH